MCVIEDRERLVRRARNFIQTRFNNISLESLKDTQILRLAYYNGFLGIYLMNKSTLDNIKYSKRLDLSIRLQDKVRASVVETLNYKKSVNADYIHRLTGILIRLRESIDEEYHNNTNLFINARRCVVSGYIKE